MLVIVIRTIILYAVVVISVRVMGKRQIGEMQPSELAVAIMISDLASVPMQAIDIPLLTGILPVLTLIIAEIGMAFLSLKSRTARKFISGEPSILIYGGHINENELRRQRFNLNDLLEQLRINGYSDLSDIEAAILETNGQLSIIPKPEARNVTVADLGIKNPKKEILPFMIVSDGSLNPSELKRSGKSEKWLMAELKKSGITDLKEVFVASYEPSDGLFVQKKGENDKK